MESCTSKNNIEPPRDAIAGGYDGDTEDCCSVIVTATATSAASSSYDSGDSSSFASASDDGGSTSSSGPYRRVLAETLAGVGAGASTTAIQEWANRAASLRRSSNSSNHASSSRGGTRSSRQGGKRRRRPSLPRSRRHHHHHHQDSGNHHQHKDKKPRQSKPVYHPEIDIGLTAVMSHADYDRDRFSLMRAPASASPPPPALSFSEQPSFLSSFLPPLLPSSTTFSYDRLMNTNNQHKTSTSASSSKSTTTSSTRSASYVITEDTVEVQQREQDEVANLQQQQDEEVVAANNTKVSASEYKKLMLDFQEYSTRSIQWQKEQYQRQQHELFAATKQEQQRPNDTANATATTTEDRSSPPTTGGNGDGLDESRHRSQQEQGIPMAKAMVPPTFGDVAVGGGGAASAAVRINEDDGVDDAAAAASPTAGKKSGSTSNSSSTVRRTFQNKRLYMSMRSVSLSDAIDLSTRPRILFEEQHPYRVVHSNAAFANAMSNIPWSRRFNKKTTAGEGESQDASSKVNENQDCQRDRFSDPALFLQHCFHSQNVKLDDIEQAICLYIGYDTPASVYEVRPDPRCDKVSHYLVEIRAGKVTADGRNEDDQRSTAGSVGTATKEMDAMTMGRAGLHDQQHETTSTGGSETDGLSIIDGRLQHARRHHSVVG